MKHLLDVNVLIAGIVKSHSQHALAGAWLTGKQIVLCPIAELGFLRICTNEKSAIGLAMDHARDALKYFAAERNAEWIPDDLSALESRPRTSDEVTDHYLLNLAATHGFRLATLDGRLHHSAVDLVS